jgi:hypothetical protein
MRHLDRFDSTSAPDDAKKAISFGATSFSSGQRKNALGFAATYTEIYACISAGLQVLGATVTVCGRMSIQPRWVLPRSLFGSR